MEDIVIQPKFSIMVYREEERALDRKIWLQIRVLHIKKTPNDTMLEDIVIQTQMYRQ